MRGASAMLLVGVIASIAVAQPGAGSGSAGSAGSGASAGSASGSGSGSPRIIQLPTDVNAPEVNAAASPSAVRIGGRFTLIITAVHAPGVTVNLEEPLDLGPAFEVRRKDSADQPRADGKTIREWQADVIAWELGDLQVPPVTVTYTVNGKLGQVQTNAVRLRVDGVLGDQVDDPRAMRDLQGPRSLIARDYFWLLVGGGAVLLVLASVTAMWIARRVRRRHVVALTGGAIAAPRRMDAASARALEALLAIETSGVLQREDERREGYAQMVEVLRTYIGARYHVATRDLTSRELVRRLARTAPDEERGLIEAWLERCDLVKYGGLEPTLVEAATVLADARELVVKTSAPRAAGSERRGAA